MKQLIPITFFFTSFLSINAQNGAIDPSFNTGTGANLSVREIKLQPDGKILIAGDFTLYNGISKNKIARLNQNGTIDSTFSIGSGFVGSPKNVLIQSDGKILVSGSFTSYNGVSCNNIVRINTNGSVDSTFNIGGSGANSFIRDVKLQTDGKLILVGDFTTYNSTSVNRIVRLNTNGSIDNTYTTGSGANGEIAGCAFQSNGKLVLIGLFDNFNGTPCDQIIRLNADGSTDLSLTTSNPNNSVPSFPSKIVIQQDDKILMSGEFFCFVRLNADGSPDVMHSQNSPTGPNLDVSTISLLQGGKIALGGIFTTYAGQSRNRFSILNPDCSLNTTINLGSAANSTVYSIAGQPNGDILIGGDFTSFNGTNSSKIIRITTCSPTTNTIVNSSCQSYNLNGQTYSATGTYTQSLTNSVGCDSIITLNFTLLSTNEIDSRIACDSLTWIDGITYYSSTNTPSITYTNISGCDSVVTLNLTINPFNNGTDVQSACDSLTWIDGTTYYSSTNTPTVTFTNSAGCDSIVTLDLTIYNSIPTTIQSTFSNASSADSCTGEFSIDFSGSPVFELIVNNGAQIINSTGTSQISGLCAGIHDLAVVNSCLDTTFIQFVVPLDSNQIFINPYNDSIPVDSLGATFTDCFIVYNSIDTAFIDSILVFGDSVTIIINIVDLNGSNFYTFTFPLINGNGVHLFQLNLMCPTKALGDFFTFTQAIYFENGVVSTAGINESSLLNFKVFPNPTTDNISVSFEGNSATLTIRDAQGKLIQSTEISNNEVVSLKAVQSGIYFFELTTENGTSMQRVVKN